MQCRDFGIECRDIGGTFWSRCHDIAVNIATLRRHFLLSEFYLFSSSSFLHTQFMLVNINLKRMRYLNSSMDNEDNLSIQCTSKFSKYSLYYSNFHSTRDIKANMKFLDKKNDTPPNLVCALFSKNKSGK